MLDRILKALRNYSNWSNIDSKIIIRPKYESELEGIDDFMYIAVLHWMPKVGSETEMNLPNELKKRGAKDKGVFAKRTPLRPNPIGVSIVRLVRQRDNVLLVNGLDAIDGTVILDIRLISRCGPPIIGKGPLQSWVPYKRRIFKEKLISDLIEKADAKKDDLVLDAGAGSGLLTFQIAKNTKVLALDISASMLKKLKELKEKEKLEKKIFPVVGAVESIPIKNCRVNVVTSGFLLKLIPDAEKMVKEFGRVLKPGGKIVLVDCYLSGIPEELSEYFAITKGFTGANHSQNKLKSVLKKSGMEDVSVYKWEEIILVAEGKKPN